MPDLPLLQNLGVIVLAGTGASLLARAIRVPSIVAYIVAGLILGPGSGLLSVSAGVELLSEMGIALLLFIVGLEISLERIRDVGRVAVVAGLGQVVFTAAGGWILCWILGFPALEGLFIATALTFSSTVVVVKLLDQKGELDSVYGRIAVGIFLVQDLVVLLVLTFLAGLGSPGAASAGGMALGVARAFLGMGVLLATAFGAGRWPLPQLFRWVPSSSDTPFVWALTWCFLLVLGAELMGLSLELGAFLAGVSLAQLPFHGDLRRRTRPLMNFLIAVFFVSLGARMPLGAAAQIWWPALVLSLFVLIGNPVIFIWIIARMGYGERTAFFTSVTVAQISEFSFIFAAMGLSAGLIPEETLSLVGLVGLVTIALSTYMILYSDWIYARMSGRWPLGIFRAARVGKEGTETDGGGTLRGHVLAVGMNSLGRSIVDFLFDRGEKVLAVDTDLAKLQDLPCPVLHGNAAYLSVLEDAGLPDARLLVSALHIEEVNRLLAYRASRLEIPSVIHAHDQAAERELQRLGVTHVLDSRQAGIARTIQALSRLGIFRG